MKVICVIPARYESSRFPGKPLALIDGKPMLLWVYNTAKSVKTFADVIVATDDLRIMDCCNKYNMHAIMTRNHKTHVDRVHEISEQIKADYYLVICGDEPLINIEQIKAVLPRQEDLSNSFYVCGACRYFTDPAEVVDPANIKIVANNNDECIFLSRAVVPFPYKTVLFSYKKVVGIECYTKESLDFFVNTEKGYLESIEDVTLQRFLENKIHIKYRIVDGFSLSVDTPRDLEKINSYLKTRNK